MERKLFTSESVTSGHPDKICDRISDAILDAILEKDSNARVACETTVTTGLVLVVGEITTETYVDIQTIVRNTVKNIGYDRGKYGFDADNLAVLTSINSQSEDIALGVDETDSHEQGAGDQGLMFGFACDETDNLMPLPIELAHKLTRRLDFVRQENLLDFLRPDGKAQVTIEYDEQDRPLRIDAVVVSSQHQDLPIEVVRKGIKELVIDAVLPSELIDENTKYFINPTGKFVIGGPKGDSGLTGRKIIVDTYGGYARHGGGAFSGKDPSKVDRSASYMARYIAKNIVASGISKKAEVQLAYAIGVAQPVSVRVDTFNTSKVSESLIEKAVRKHFDLTPKGIINTLDLKRPIYEQTSNYGHMGREDIDLPWEKLNKIDIFKDLL
ncbi:MAG: methionine adenosyltransferase [Paracholeplasma sp.]|uniref:S-adenosylmethionine synthase n=1 Tax=Acholeplasma brassicae TaxID=61635 RepID=U4KSW3_9MOLU|nr:MULTISPECIES: methionine adenosyltransferase [Paracholeplasma]MDY3195550.1 methionine adenosyltransferase [Paracholeplasma sp.]CCV65639.1 S-adenosylmethionine synthase [Paracholeplasma brassicae]